MTTVKNTGSYAGSWGRLVNAETLEGLSLDVGESAPALIWLEPTDEAGNITGPAKLTELPADFHGMDLEVVSDSSESVAELRKQATALGLDIERRAKKADILAAIEAENARLAGEKNAEVNNDDELVVSNSDAEEISDVEEIADPAEAPVTDITKE